MAGGVHPGHMQDHEAHVAWVEADLEYFRTKRLEPRVFFVARRGIVTVYDLLRASVEVPPTSHQHERAGVEERIQALETRLDELITEIAVVSLMSHRSGDVVIEDTRKERGDYDEFFRIAKRTHGGPLEARVAQLERELADCRWLVEVFARALVAAGEVTEEQLQTRREDLRGRGHRNGARIVARTWVDPEFKRRLIQQGRQVVRELDIPPGRLGKLGVAENTEDEHNVVVCTLCSCYPHDLLGNPPWWYRSDAYKQRIVEDPRAALREMFDLEVPGHVRIIVHDSTSDIRWMVLPRRPAGTEGMSEEDLARLVTPESLVGVAPALEPEQLREATT